VVAKYNKEKTWILQQILALEGRQELDVQAKRAGWAAFATMLRDVNMELLRKKDGEAWNQSYRDKATDLDRLSYSGLKSAVSALLQREKHADVVAGAKEQLRHVFTLTLDNTPVMIRGEAPPADLFAKCSFGIVYDQPHWRCITSVENANPALLEQKSTLRH
jgi:hypothetical protein